jgi:hypothetical protein
LNTAVGPVTTSPSQVLAPSTGVIGLGASVVVTSLGKTTDVAGLGASVEVVDEVDGTTVPMTPSNATTSPLGLSSCDIKPTPTTVRATAGKI